MQEVQDTTRVNLMMIQAIRTPRGVRSEWPISWKGVRSHLGPVFRTKLSISCPLGIQTVWSGHSQGAALIMKAGVVGRLCTRCSDHGTWPYGCTGVQTHSLREIWTADQ